MISGATRVAMVIGSPVQHSLSPALHNAAFRQLRVDWVYVAAEVAKGLDHAHRRRDEQNLPLNIVHLELDGYEADDIIGTLSLQAQQAGWQTMICTGDRDTLQLVTDDVTVLYPRKGVSDLVRMTPATVLERYFVPPAQYPELAFGRVDDAKAVVSALPQSAANNPAMRRIESSCAFPQRIQKGAATQKIQGDDK